MAHIYDDWDINEVKTLYQEQGYTQNDLADYFGVSSGSVNKFLHENKIKKRPWRSDEEIAADIRAGLAHIINGELARSLTIARDEDDPDLWVVNDYVPSKGGNEFPAEVHIRYDRRNDILDIEKFELRGKERSDLSDDLDRWI